MANELSVLTAGAKVAAKGARTFNTPVAGEQFSAGAAPDAGLAAADALRNSPLNAIPQDLIPNGETHFHASAKISFFSRDLGEATVVRTDKEIDVNASTGQIAITVDPTNPSEIDIASASGSKYVGTLHSDGNGFIANTNDGKSLAIHNSGSGLDVKAHGFPGIPDSAKITLKRE